MSEISSTLHPRERALIPDASSTPGLNAPRTARDSRQDLGLDLLNGQAPFGLAIEIRGDLRAAASEWKVFEPLADCTPFQTFAWLEQWQRHVGARRGTVPVLV